MHFADGPLEGKATLTENAGRNPQEQEVRLHQGHHLGVHVEIVITVVLEVAVIGKCLCILQHTAQHSLALGFQELDELLLRQSDPFTHVVQVHTGYTSTRHGEQAQTQTPM